jgi:hypothetical protein
MLVGVEFVFFRLTMRPPAVLTIATVFPNALSDSWPLMFLPTISFSSLFSRVFRAPFGYEINSGMPQYALHLLLLDFPHTVLPSYPSISRMGKGFFFLCSRKSVGDNAPLLHVRGM